MNKLKSGSKALHDIRSSLTPARTAKVTVEKESRLAQAYTDGIMDETIYHTKYEEVSDTRNDPLKQIRVIENETGNSPVLPLEKIVYDVVKLVQDLDFTNKKAIIQKLLLK